MTEKRFVPIFDRFDKRVVGAKDNGVIISFMDMFDLLNELAEENQDLATKKEDAEYELLHLKEKYEELLEENAKLKQENKKLKLQNGELLYQIGEVGKNNKTCRECECFIPEIKYCYMWDMEVEADDVVVACDQRKVKNNGDDKK